MPHTNINRVVLTGRLTRDPELRALPSGMTVCRLRLACGAMRKGAEGEYERKPNYFSVSVFGNRAEAVSRYMRKGRQVGVDGRLAWSEWEGSDGQRRQSVEVVADNVEFLDRAAGEEQGADGAGADGGSEPEAAQHAEPVGAGAAADLPF